MTPMLDFFVNMVTNTTTLKWLLGGVAVAMASIAAYSIYISREKNKQIAMQIRLLSTQVYLSSLAAQESLAKNKTAISSGTIASEDSARIAIQQALTGGAIVESAAKNSAANAPFTGGFGAVGIITSILAVLGSAAAMYGVYSALPTATAMPDVPSSVISPANPNIPESYGSNSGRMSGAPSVNVNLQNNIDPWTGKASVSYSSQYGAVPDNSIGQFRITN